MSSKSWWYNMSHHVSCNVTSNFQLYIEMLWQRFVTVSNPTEAPGVTALIWQLFSRVAREEPFIYLAFSYDFSLLGRWQKREPFSSIITRVIMCYSAHESRWTATSDCEWGSIRERWLLREKGRIIGSAEIRLNVRNESGHSTRCCGQSAQSFKTRSAANHYRNANQFSLKRFKTSDWLPKPL